MKVLNNRVSNHLCNNESDLNFQLFDVQLWRTYYSIRPQSTSIIFLTSLFKIDWILNIPLKFGVIQKF